MPTEPEIRAIVHTVGVRTSEGIYVPLEVAYRDYSGLEKHFVVDCGIRLWSDSQVAVPIDDVHRFISDRFQAIASEFGHSCTYFGCRGSRTQSRFLCDAGVPNVSSLDYRGVPKLATLDPEYGGTNRCNLHVGGRGKCALSAVRLMAPIVFGDCPVSIVRRIRESIAGLVRYCKLI